MTWDEYKKTNGRRELRARLEMNYRFVEVIEGSPMLRAKTAPRSVRRKLHFDGLLPFRPIYGFRGGE